MVEGDPGYELLQAAFLAGKHCFVFLDGAEVRSCVTADEEEGFVVADVLDEDGLPQISPVNPEEFWTERRDGSVKIEIRNA
jgi:hypothetical protein